MAANILREQPRQFVEGQDVRFTQGQLGEFSQIIAQAEARGADAGAIGKARLYLEAFGHLLFASKEEIEGFNQQLVRIGVIDKKLG